MLAGTRAGKTSWGPWWLWRAMRRGLPGTYLAAAPTFKLLDKGILPELENAFCRILNLGRIVGGAAGEFRVSERGHRQLWPGRPYKPSRIVFGHAENPDSLEAMTAQAAWLDECAQKMFRQGSWEAIQRRLSIHQGPALLTTTPYLLAHWVKTDVYDRAVRKGTPDERPGDADFAVVSFDSRMNPAFPADEWERAQAVLPPWRFDLFYRGRFTRPAGAVYDCFDPARHVLDGAGFRRVFGVTDLPAHWPRYCGIDFGSPNFAAVFIAAEAVPDGGLSNGEPNYKQTGRLFAYREYRPGASRTAEEHVAAMRACEPGRVAASIGGSKSEGQWRAELGRAGWRVSEPDQPDVEVGIERVYAAIKQDQFYVGKACPRLAGELAAYSRPVDEAGEVQEGIEDKATWHLCDATRYGVGWLRRRGTPWHFEVVEAPGLSGSPLSFVRGRW